MIREPDRNLVNDSISHHTTLRELSEKLAEYLDRPRPEAHEPEAHEWASALYRQLAKLHQKVSYQYRDQKQVGFHTRLSERYPRAAERLQQLRTEHEEILGDLRAVVSAAMSYAESQSPPNPRLREWTRGLLEAIASHESAETALIQDLVSTDVGAGD